MKITLLFILLTFIACTSPSTYRAATGDGIGYKDIALGPDHYRVQFKVRGHARNTAGDYALLRAAELTLAQEYDWFLVENRRTRLLNDENTSAQLPRQIITRNCGLLGCRASSYSLPAEESGIPNTETLAVLDIRMGRGVRPEKESYDAREVLEALPVKRE